jgi:hypothetical protein
LAGCRLHRARRSLAACRHPWRRGLSHALQVSQASQGHSLPRPVGHHGVPSHTGSLPVRRGLEAGFRASPLWRDRSLVTGGGVGSVDRHDLRATAANLLRQSRREGQGTGRRRPARFGGGTLPQGLWVEALRRPNDRQGSPIRDRRRECDELSSRPLPPTGLHIALGSNKPRDRSLYWCRSDPWIWAMAG